MHQGRQLGIVTEGMRMRTGADVLLRLSCLVTCSLAIGGMGTGMYKLAYHLHQKFAWFKDIPAIDSG